MTKEEEFIFRLMRESEEKTKKYFSSKTAFELPSSQPFSAPIGKLNYLDVIYQRDGIKFFERDEFYAYDDMLRSYLDNLYPSFLIREAS